MSGFSELIKNFGKTRDYVRDFFIYGFKVRGDFSRKSARTYDDERRRVESWLGDFVRYDDSERGRQVSLTVDCGHITENPLYQAFYAKSFTDNDIRLHFLLTDLLADGLPHTLRDITDALNTEYGALFDEQTVRGKLREYTAEGIILTEKRGRTSYYQLSPDTADALLDEIPGLADAVRFFSQVQPFGVAGDSILRETGLKNDIFLMKHNYIVRTLEDEQLLRILDAMEEKRFLTFRVLSSRSALNEGMPVHEEHCVPLQIRTSLQTGRRYLTGYVPEYRRFNSFRLDFISDAKAADICPEYDDLRGQLEQNLPRLFGVSFGMRQERGNTEPLRVTLYIPEEERFVLDRIRREIRCGTVRQTGENTYLMTLGLFDPKEALPWLRTFTGRVLSVEGGCEEMREQFYQDNERMMKLYEEA